MSYKTNGHENAAEEAREALSPPNSLHANVKKHHITIMYSNYFHKILRNFMQIIVGLLEAIASLEHKPHLYPVQPAFFLHHNKNRLSLNLNILCNNKYPKIKFTNLQLYINNTAEDL